MVNTCGEENFQGVPRFHCTELLLAANVAGQWRIYRVWGPVDVHEATAQPAAPCGDLLLGST